jgi:hypothetical protein
MYVQAMHGLHLSLFYAFLAIALDNTLCFGFSPSDSRTANFPTHRESQQLAGKDMMYAPLTNQLTTTIPKLKHSVSSSIIAPAILKSFYQFYQIVQMRHRPKHHPTNSQTQKSFNY